ncbi:C-type lectin domain family 4 member E-like isoform X1 [Acanthochromis polyacanthus]|uniref:C-type lectin domain family 4 member E-like isoform X1 n=1 Tax=Acanthochromis polyacanthus TaxID=80966 RepID=UPI002234D5B6|nr:C-type lectin domain family 4 member E-like isoform X1 [Acanthochromis polyacanthus]
MPESEVLYSDVTFTRPKANAAETFSPLADTTYSEVKIAKKQPPEESPAGFHEDESSRKLKVTSERVALLVLTVLLAAAVIALGVTVFDNKRTKEELKSLKMELETLNKSLSAETKPSSTVQPTCPPPPAVGSYEPCPKCEAGWEHHGGKCYNFTTNKSSWEESRCFCQSQGGDLVKIDSRDEQSFLERRLRDVMEKAEDKFWIGLTDSKEEGRWLWVDGSLLVERLKFWSSGEPDNWKEEDPDGEDCARMGEKVGAHDLKCWFDHSCKNPHRSICEKPEKTGQRSYVCV